VAAADFADYPVKKVIPDRGLVVVWGPPKSGKSFWAFTVSMHIGLGREYRGHRVKQGKVLYMALEGAAGFDNRAKAFGQRYLDEGEKAPESSCARRTWT
jgi:hypothetical protein